MTLRRARGRRRLDERFPTVATTRPLPELTEATVESEVLRPDNGAGTGLVRRWCDSRYLEVCLWQPCQRVSLFRGEAMTIVAEIVQECGSCPLLRASGSRWS